MSNIDGGGMLAGLCFVILGVVFLLAQLGLVAIRLDLFVPAALVGLGVLIVVRSLMRHRN